MQRPGRPRVLIVDDQPQNIEVLAEALGAAYDLVAATTPALAIERARSGVDLILLDVVMPDQDGFELCRSLKSDPATRDVPVIFVTALGEVQDEARGFEVGGVDYITKPISPPTVRARVRTHLDLCFARRRLEREAETLSENLRLKDHVERLGRHDLKTPLGSIVSIPQILREQGGLSPDQTRLLDTVETAGYRILEMVNRSLDLFRMESGSYAFEPERVDLAQLARRVAEDLAPPARDRDVAIDVRAGEGDLDAAAEELLSYSMLANLIKNAVEATGTGGRVGVEVRRDGGHIAVAIHNPGAVPPELRESFFRKYASHGKRSGSGLGAYSARLMALTQSGGIEMSTDDDAGTTLTVRLQAHGPTAAAGAHAAAPTSEIRRNVTPRLVFLVVDDDEPTRFVLARILEGARAIHHASNGRDALARAREADPDVVLLDAEMPLLDGFGAAARIRAWEASSRARRRLLVGLSAHGDAATERAFLEAGCDLVLGKPVSRRALLEALDGAALRYEGATGTSATGTDEVEIDADLVPHMDRFMVSRRAQATDLVEALGAGDLEAARRLAHKLRGGLDMCGFASASALARGLEEALATGDAAGAPAQAASLRDYLGSVRWRARDAS